MTTRTMFAGEFRNEKGVVLIISPPSTATRTPVSAHACSSHKNDGSCKIVLVAKKDQTNLRQIRVKTKTDSRCEHFQKRPASCKRKSNKMSSQTRLEARGSLSVLKNKESLSVLANIGEVRWFSRLVVRLQIATWGLSGHIVLFPCTRNFNVVFLHPCRYINGYLRNTSVGAPAMD